MMETLGIAQAAIARAQKFADRFPILADRILGKKESYYTPAKGARISVDLRTGERTIERISMDQSSHAIAAEAAKYLLKKKKDEEEIQRNRQKKAIDSRADVEMILMAVCRASGLGRSAISSHSHEPHIMRARHLFWYILAALRRDLSYPHISRVLGGRPRDHTTIMSAVAKFDRKLKRMPVLSDLCYHPAVKELFQAAYDNPRIGKMHQ